MKAVSHYHVNDAEVNVKRLLLEFPELVEDEQLLMDAIEGQTDLVEIVKRLVDAVSETGDWVDVLSERINTIKARRDRLKRRVSFWRAMALRLMEAAQIKKLEFSEASIHVVNAAETVEVISEEEIPEEYVRTEIVKTVDKVELKRALKSGRSVPGVVLSNGGVNLQIRER